MNRPRQQLFAVTFDESGIKLRVRKCRMRKNSLENGHVGLKPTHYSFRQHGQKPLAGFFAVFAPRDEFGYHGVIEW
ncbi:hypothetical protein D3C76_1388540 [compost metagenome]